MTGTDSLADLVWARGFTDSAWARRHTTAGREIMPSRRVWRGRGGPGDLAGVAAGRPRRPRRHRLVRTYSHPRPTSRRGRDRRPARPAPGPTRPRGVPARLRSPRPALQRLGRQVLPRSPGRDPRPRRTPRPRRPGRPVRARTLRHCLRRRPGRPPDAHGHADELHAAARTTRPWRRSATSPSSRRGCARTATRGPRPSGNISPPRGPRASPARSSATRTATSRRSPRCCDGSPGSAPRH